tara:strand:+ start:5929 stop:8346 length:2418 start_codon:yes stop_codon:yes gene_type:complete
MDAKLRAIMLSVMMLLCLTILPQGSSSEAENTNQIPNCHADRNGSWTMGLISCTNSTSPGYTLFSPMPSTSSYLIDQHGREIHSWESPGGHRPGLASYLLEDGDLLRSANIAQQAVGDFSGGGTAGKIERIGWDGTAEWSWEYSSMDYITHHDIEPMPNGNILAIAWEDKSEAEALQAGRNPAIASDAPGGNANVWPDHIIEIEPLANNQANIVWEWHAWDHLIQDYDASKDNYGVVSEHPELLDINFVGATGNQAGRADWMHCNGIDYNAALDQIALSCKNTNEFYIIDHSTTTAEAAGHTGGNSGKGGDFLYRWGNPQAYDGGLSSDQQLFGQHDVQWIEEGREGSGDFLVFNNGNGRSPSYSSVDVIQVAYVEGNYPLQSNGTWGPNAPSWSWGLNQDIYAQSISGAERLPNGNTLVTFGTQGTLLEVDLEGEIVWKYISPVTNQGILSQGDEIPAGNNAGSTANVIFKVRRYAVDLPVFTEKGVTPGDYLETWTDLCPEEESIPWDSDGDGCIDDSDGDSVEDPNDVCWGFDDATDVDNDSIPDGCDSFIDSDSDGVEDSIDLCPGFDDALDVDNDSIPDDCDVLLDNDSDGIANSDDMCEGFDDSLDTDEDSIPDGCDTQVDDQQNSSQDSETEMGNNSATNIDNLTTDDENLSGSNQNDSIQQEINQPGNGTDVSNDAESKSSEMSMTPKLIMSLLLIGTGVWLLLYLVAIQFFKPKEEVEQKKTDVLFLESGIQDSTNQFTDVNSMIDLPPIPLLAAAQPEIQQPRQGFPPVPIEGLPEGWTLEQWNYYGQQWLDAQK